MAKNQFARPVIREISEDDYRAFFDSEVMRVWHLRGKDRTFKIMSVMRIDSTFRGEDRKQPLLLLVDRHGREQLPLALNKTNAKTVAALYGKKPSAWIGKTITLFPTTTDVGGEVTECIRIRPEIPGSRQQGKSQPRQESGNVRRLSAPAPAQEEQKQPVADVEFDDGEDDDEPRDVTDDDEEPPPGALSTDNVDDVIK